MYTKVGRGQRDTHLTTGVALDWETVRWFGSRPGREALLGTHRYRIFGPRRAYLKARRSNRRHLHGRLDACSLARTSTPKRHSCFNTGMPERRSYNNTLYHRNVGKEYRESIWGEGKEHSCSMPQVGDISSQFSHVVITAYVLSAAPFFR